MPPRTQADLFRAQAIDALRRGEAALARDDHAAASAWLARAHRIVPDDPAVAFALASAMLGLRDKAAIALFERAADATQTREAWLGLSAACWQADDMTGGVAALAQVLSRHVLPANLKSLSALADAMAVAAGAAGWCGVVADGKDRVLRLVTGGERKPLIRVDGRTIRGNLLPAGGMATVTVAGRDLLGSPIDLARLRAVEGFVGATAEGGLQGWIWVPADPDAEPCVTIAPVGSGQSARVTLRATDTDMTAERPLARPRRFGVAPDDLRCMAGPLRVTAANGAELAGSPVDPGAELRAAMWVARCAAALEPARIGASRPAPSGPADLPTEADLRGPGAVAPLAPLRPVAVVVPVYRGLGLTLACLESVLGSCPTGTPMIVVDDATPEPDLARALDRLADDGRITLLRHVGNQGFPASANAGLRAAFALRPLHDAVLLNSDTLVPRSRTGWIERLRACVHAAPDIGTATPLSNDATILSYPDRDRPGPAPDAAALGRLDALASRANAGLAVEIPTAVGFCMYIRHECARDTGLFRAALFAQGYGEENDFCLRARHLGWRHVAVPGVVVGHVGGVSFGAAKSALVARNLAVLERLYPGYRAMIAAYEGVVPATDSLAPARLRLDAARWAAARAAPAQRHAVILVTHDRGGGVERVVRRRVAALQNEGARAILLRPVADPNSDGGSLPGLCRVDDGSGGFPNLIFRLPDDLKPLARLLRADRPSRFEVHHRLGHHPAIIDLATELALSLDLMLHDYASFCPRVTLLGPEQRYCGEPDDVAVCEACVADAGSRLDEPIGVAALRARSAVEFAGARAISVPSADMAQRMRRHFPGFAAAITPLEDDAAVLPPARPPARSATAAPRRRICVIGAIGIEKGFDVLLACARDAARRDLKLEFVLVGRSTDDDRLLDTGRVFVTGQYREEDALALIGAQCADVAFLPSIWPETWGFTLGLAWRAGLRAVVFDVGAMAARVRATGHGLVLPLGLPPAAINNALITPAPSALRRLLPIAGQTAYGQRSAQPD
jgi:GT2 family glycosyltransferase/glycosyltransferase involved in cell wall biosynthesis